jgi:hypothetical protein
MCRAVCVSLTRAPSSVRSAIILLCKGDRNGRDGTYFHGIQTLVCGELAASTCNQVCLRALYTTRPPLSDAMTTIANKAWEIWIRARQMQCNLFAGSTQQKAVKMQHARSTDCANMASSSFSLQMAYCPALIFSFFYGDMRP